MCLPCAAGLAAEIIAAVAVSAMASQSIDRKHLAPVAQLDRASVFGTEGWGFESLRARSQDYICQ